MNAARRSGAVALVEALGDAGVDYLFGNFGSDHAGVIEALAQSQVTGHKVPEVIICPHETVALTAAHGYAQVTRRTQAVFVHVDVGTQNLGGALHNAQRGRAPVFIFAGATPFTLRGELPGSRNREANYSQDVFDQRGIVRPYVKWEYDLRTARNTGQVVARALQIAASEPCGPVYLTAAREVLEQDAGDEPAVRAPLLAPGGLAPQAAEHLARALAGAQNPIVITSYAGRDTQTPAVLVRLSERLGAGVIEQRPTRVNFPADHPQHLGYEPGPHLADADVILVLDCDFPWIPVNTRSRADADVYVLDIDPLKEQVPLWHIPVTGYYRADSRVALEQIETALDRLNLCTETGHALSRLQMLASTHKAQRTAWRDDLGEALTPARVAATLAELLEDDAVVLSEAVTSNSAVQRYLPRRHPGTFFASGGSALGWGLGAALGVKLAAPAHTVVALVGDGSYYFGVPASVYWTARRYQAPFLTVIFNNRGWNATRQNVLRIHPEGAAARNGQFFSSFEPGADLAGIAHAAGGAEAYTVSEPEQLRDTLRQALDTVRGGRCAVVDARIAPV